MSAESPVIIRQARILLPTNEFLVGDVELRGGQIVQVASQLSLSDQPSPDRILDVGGQIAFEKNQGGGQHGHPPPGRD